MTDVLVIGGGLAGLAAAATAANDGADVTLVEARADEGGRARTATGEGGFLFNQGPHALYAGSCGIEVLRELGVEPQGKRPPLRGYGILRGKLGLLPGTPVDALKSSLVGTRAKLQLGRAVGNPKKMLRSDVAGRSMREWIDAHASDPDARAIIAMAARVATYCADLDHITATAAVTQTVSSLVDGVLYLDGGWQQLVDGLRVAAERAGVKIVTGAKATAVEAIPGTDRLRVMVGETEHDVDALVIANGGPQHADELLGGGSATVQRWAAEAHPVHAASLDLGLRALPVPERRIVFGIDEPLYLSVHTPSAALAPEGGELVHVMRYGTDGRAATALRAELEAFLDRAQPGWREQVVAERFNRSLVVAYGRPEVGVERPTAAVGDMPGVFVAGDWVGPDGLLADASLASGRAAGHMAARR